MDRIRTYLGRKPSSSVASAAAGHHHEYAPLRDPDDSPVLEEPHRMTGSTTLLGVDGECNDEEEDGDLELGLGHEAPFRWVEYLIFGLVGVAMLWAWNMFLAASPYFSSRLYDAPGLQHSSQSAIISVSTVTNLAVMAILMNIQYTASYPYRINVALLMNIGVFTLLTLSTFVWTDASAASYFVFLLLAVAATAWAAGLMQNGAFAFAASFGRPEYTQAIMTGQALAGILPPITQMASVVLVPSPSAPSSTYRDDGSGSGDGNGGKDGDAGMAAFIYFLTAVLVSSIALVSFQPLVLRHNRQVEARMGGVDAMASSFHSVEEAERASRKVVTMLTLWHKLKWLAAAVFGCFAVTMFFPIFTARIVSVTTGLEDSGRIDSPSFFIPLGFFFWNLGDLLGRISSSVPQLSLRQRPPLLLLAAMLRLGFLPLYALCDVDGEGAVVRSDWFYLLLVQLPFGLTNGWLGSSCMMAAGEWVDEMEREAAGGFMGFALMAGLTVGSLASFSVAGG